MTFGIRILRMFLPKQESQRMELRRTILEAEACADDLRRTIVKMHKPKTNGKKKP